MKSPKKKSIFFTDTEAVGAAVRKNTDKWMIVRYALFLLVPILVFQLLFYLNGYGFHFFKIIPVWNDEISWWSQVSATVRDGAPLGYVGYNGTHAEVGTFGPWGVAPLIPYVLFGKIFGWHLYSMAYANVLFMSIAVFLFCLLTRPDKKQLRWLLFAYIFSCITIAYNYTAMAEGYRYAMGIVLVGTALWLRDHAKDIRKPDWKTIVIYVVCLAVLFYAINVYLIFAVMALVFLWFMLKGLKPGWRIAFAVLGTVVLAAAAYKVTGMYIAPYTTSTIATLLNTLHEKGLYFAFCQFLSIFFYNLQTVGLFYITFPESEILQWYFFSYMVILTVLAVVCVKRVMDDKKAGRRTEVSSFFSGNCFFALYLVAGFLLGYCALYTGAAATLCRGTNTGLLMALLLIAMGDWDAYAEPKQFRLTKYVLVLLFILGLPCVWKYHYTIIYEREENIAKTDVILEEKEKLEEVIEISPDRSRWENTIAQYGELDNLYLALPDGSGTNYMIDEEDNQYAGYAVYRSDSDEEDVEKWSEMLEKSGHKLIFEDELFTVYQNENMKEEQ